MKFNSNVLLFKKCRLSFHAYQAMQLFWQNTISIPHRPNGCLPDLPDEIAHAAESLQCIPPVCGPLFHLDK